jgi:hypothetical protein
MCRSLFRDIYDANLYTVNAFYEALNLPLLNAIEELDLDILVSVLKELTLLNAARLSTSKAVLKDYFFNCRKRVITNAVIKDHKYQGVIFTIIFNFIYLLNKHTVGSMLYFFFSLESGIL